MKRLNQVSQEPPQVDPIITTPTTDNGTNGTGNGFKISPLLLLGIGIIGSLLFFKK